LWQAKEGQRACERFLDADGTFNPPKRNKSRRTVKLTSQAVEALRLHRKRQNEERLKATRWEDHSLVFPNRVGKLMDHNNRYHRDFKSLLKRAGLWSEER
jgi:integrase